MFIDKNEYSNVIEDQNNFLIKIEDFKPYMVEFKKDGKIKPKIYPFDYVIGDIDWQPIIIITYDECTFSANNSIWRAWTRVEDIFLRLKSHGQGIMPSEFLLLFNQLNLAFLSLEKRDKAVEKCGLISMKAMEIFEYRKNNDRYWDRVKLY